MALATRCPNCHALFRVVADQLKLRGGLVRCGACRHAFDAIGTLSYIDDAVLAGDQPAPAAPSVGRAAAAPESAPQNASDPTHGDLAAGTVPQTERAAADTPPERSGTHELPDAPIVHIAGRGDDSPRESGATTAVEANAVEAEAPGEPLAGRQGDAGLPPADNDRTELAADAAETAEAPAPAFLQQADAPRRRGRSVLLGIGVVVLLLLAVAQLAVAFRADLLVRFPQARPALTELCKVFRCTVNWPARGDLLAVVGSELQALPGTSAFELTAVVRNRGSFTLALPAVELTLTDTLNRALARKVFAPADYLAAEADPAARLRAGIEPAADLTIRITFEARGLNAAGFVVYPFYL